MTYMQRCRNRNSDEVGFPPPTCWLETLPGNEQWGYLDRAADCAVGRVNQEHPVLLARARTRRPALPALTTSRSDRPAYLSYEHPPPPPPPLLASGTISAGATGSSIEALAIPSRSGQRITVRQSEVHGAHSPAFHRLAPVSVGTRIVHLVDRQGWSEDRSKNVALYGSSAPRRSGVM